MTGDPETQPTQLPEAVASVDPNHRGMMGMYFFPVTYLQGGFLPVINWSYNLYVDPFLNGQKIG